MNTKDAAQELLGKGSIAMFDLCKHHEKLVDTGFARESRKGIYATDATPLALLTPTQFICAQQLANLGCILLGDIQPAQKKHMQALASSHFATYNGCKWEETDKLVKALRCWRAAKSAKVAYKAASEVSAKSINAAKAAAEEAWALEVKAHEAAKAAAQEHKAQRAISAKAWEDAQEAAKAARAAQEAARAEAAWDAAWEAALAAQEAAKAARAREAIDKLESQ